VTTTTTKDVKATWRDTEDESRVPTDMPKAAEAVVIAGKSQEDDTVAGAEVAGPEAAGPRAGPGAGPGPQLVAEGLGPTRRRPGAEEGIVEDNPTVPPIEDGTGTQTTGITYENSLGE
jgi:hypothetical protein